MITAIIVEDEAHCVERLTRLLSEPAFREVRLLGHFSDVGSALKGIGELGPDIVFLDVQIGDRTGFDLLQEIGGGGSGGRGAGGGSGGGLGGGGRRVGGEFPFAVIFTTAYERYAVQAFKFSAIDYLLKPIASDDLRAAIDKVAARRSKDEMAQKIDVLLQNAQSASKRICVPVINGLIFLSVADIIRCQSEVNYTNIFLNNKQKLLVAKTLKEFEEMLVDCNFFRVHNSHLINLNQIKSYNKGKGGFVTMSDDSIIEVSTRRKDDFLKRIMD